MYPETFQLKRLATPCKAAKEEMHQDLGAPGCPVGVYTACTVNALTFWKMVTMDEAGILDRVIDLLRSRNGRSLAFLL